MLPFLCVYVRAHFILKRRKENAHLYYFFHVFTKIHIIHLSASQLCTNGYPRHSPVPARRTGPCVRASCMCMCVRACVGCVCVNTFERTRERYDDAVLVQYFCKVLG